MLINLKDIFISSRIVSEYVDFLKGELAEVEQKIIGIELYNLIQRLNAPSEKYNSYSYIHSLLELKKRKKKLACKIKSYQNLIKMQYTISKCKSLSYYRRLLSRLKLDKINYMGLTQIIIGIIQIVIALKSLNKTTPQFAIMFSNYSSSCRRAFSLNATYSTLQIST